MHLLTSGYRKIALASCILSIAWAGCVNRNYTPGSTTGVIIVDSPEVFTRERVVNDRYNQVTWLSDQLQRCDQTSGFQGFSEAKSTETLAGSFSANILRSQQMAKKLEANPPQQQGTPPDTSKTPSLAETIAGKDKSLLPDSSIAESRASSSPIDSFRDRQACREEVRSERNQAELDDRHDLEGQTIYNFKFDATIIPEHDSSALAVVRIQLNPACESLAAGGHCKKERRQLFENWRQHIEHFLTDLYVSRINLLKSNLLPVEDIESLLAFATTQIKSGETLSTNTEYFLQNLKPYKTAPDEDKQRVVSPEASSDTYIRLNKVLRTLHGRIPYMNDQPEQTASQVVREQVAREYGAKGKYGKYFTICPGYESIIVSPRLEQTAHECPATPETSTSLDPLGDEEPWGLQEFLSRIQNEYPNGEIFSYAVTPKESVQRISDVGSYREASQFLLNLSAISGTVDTRAAMDFFREREVLTHAIRRQPLIVGFGSEGKRLLDHRNYKTKLGTVASLARDKDNGKETSPTGTTFIKEDGPDSGATAGWVIGPKFALSPDGTHHYFRHVPIQNSLSATVSLPGWWKSVAVKVDTCWLGETVNTCQEHPFQNGGYGRNSAKTYSVKIPGDVRVLDHILGDSQLRRPTVFFPQGIKTYGLTVGKTSNILIHGSNLWRSTVVMVGPWKADAILILPNMEGIQATFSDTSTRQWDVPDGAKLPIKVWTSEGWAYAGDALIHATSTGKTTFTGLGFDVGYYVLNTDLVIKADTDSIPQGYSDIRLEIRRYTPKGTPLLWTSPPTPTTARDGKIVAKFPTCGTCVNGDSIEVSIVLKTSPLAEETRHLVKKTLVFYPDNDSAQAKLVSSGTPSDITIPTITPASEISIQFPQNVSKAFSGFDPEKVNIKTRGEDTTAPQLSFSTKNCAVINNQFTCQYTVSVSGQVSGKKKYTFTVESEGEKPTVKGTLTVGQ